MLNKFKNLNLRPRNIIGALVGITFFVSIVYVIIRLFIAPITPDESLPFQKLRSDYVLMLMQCILGLVLIFLPYILEKKWRIFLPDLMYVLFFIFLYCAIYLGEVRSFYYNINHWDTILHGISAAMLATLGFNIVNVLNDATIVDVKLSPFFVAFFAFCFAVTCGAIWEIYEFTFDGILGFNMQKYATYTGDLLIGRDALVDTMKDIIVDTIGSLIICIIGYGQLKVGKFHEQRLIRRETPSE